jgi:hypothetical protein
MNAIKYIGMDVHLATISIAVLDVAGKPLMEVTIATRASTLVDFIRGFSRGERAVENHGKWCRSTSQRAAVDTESVGSRISPNPIFIDGDYSLLEDRLLEDRCGYEGSVLISPSVHEAPAVSELRQFPRLAGISTQFPSPLSNWGSSFNGFFVSDKTSLKR